MNELRRNIEKYIKRCKKEIDRIENVTIENPQKVYTNVKLQDRAIILEKVKNDLTEYLKADGAEETNISDEKMEKLKAEMEELLCKIENRNEPILGHRYIRVDYVLRYLYKMCDIFGLKKDRKQEEVSRREMNDREQEIMRYLEGCYCGARTIDDESCQIRIARAIAAFKADPKENPSEQFAERFIN